MYNRDRENVTFAAVMGTKESIEEEPDDLESVGSLVLHYLSLFARSI